MTVTQFAGPIDLGERLQALHDDVRRSALRATIGGLVSEFTNEELRLLADSYLSIQEVQELRNLGLLAPTEGFDVAKAMANGNTP